MTEVQRRETKVSQQQDAEALRIYALWGQRSTTHECRPCAVGQASRVLPERQDRM